MIFIVISYVLNTINLIFVIYTSSVVCHSMSCVSILIKLRCFRVWQFVSKAIISGDTSCATHEKLLVEEAQRNSTRERKARVQVWTPRYFERNSLTNDWIYKYAESVDIASHF